MASFVGKGMGELDKLNIMVKMEYIAILKSVELHHCKDKNQQTNTEAEEEELRFMEAVVRSVSFLGRWTLSFQPTLAEVFP